MLSAPVHEARLRPGRSGDLVTACCPSEQPAPARGPAARIQRLRRPEAGHGEAAVQARSRPRLKQKQEFQGHLPTSPPRPVRSYPLPGTVFLLNPEVIGGKKKKKRHRFHFQNVVFCVHVIKNKLCLAGISQHGKKPLVSPESPLELGWL